MLEVMRITNVITYTMRAPLHETCFQDYHIPAVSLELIFLSESRSLKKVKTIARVRCSKQFTKPWSSFLQNTHIVFKLSCFHTSKDIWGDPEAFRPERFLDPNQNRVINSEKIFTFGYGMSCNL
jgi:hypothetical protein